MPLAPLHAERKALQDAIDSLRFDCKIYEGYVPFQSSGFLPCVFNGTESGFEIYFGLLPKASRFFQQRNSQPILESR